MIINREISLENLVLARDLFASKGIRMFLHFGTLLGALREKDFIAHDDDVDVGVFGADKETFLSLRPEIERMGFEFVYMRRDRHYKFKRMGEELDFFFVEEDKGPFGRKWDLDGRTSIPAHHLDSLDEIEFLGERFLVPHDPYGVVRNLYGRTWNIPIESYPARIDWSTRLAKLLKRPGKLFFYLKRFFTSRAKKQSEARRSLKDR